MGPAVFSRARARANVSERGTGCLGPGSGAAIQVAYAIPPTPRRSESLRRSWKLSSGLRPNPPPCLGCGSGASWMNVRVSWAAFQGPLGGLSGASGRLLGASWGPLGGFLGASGMPLGASRGRLGGLWGAVGANLGRKARHVISYSPSWALLGLSWAVLRAPGAVLGPSWAVLGPSWAVLGPS